MIQKCACGRIKIRGKWVRPAGKDLKKIEINIHNIEFIQERCSYCENRKGTKWKTIY
jgi:predicted nucleic-acid-binding Zn-ribbon protein